MKIFKIVAAILLLLTGCSQSVSSSSEVPIKISDRVDLKFSEFIRNYANNINNVRVEYMKKIGIPENVISNEMMPNNYIKILNDSIIKLF